jgi:transposase
LILENGSAAAYPMGGKRPRRSEKRSEALARVSSSRHPTVNPIEQVFAKLKAILRKVGARTVDDLWRAFGNALANAR